MQAAKKETVFEFPEGGIADFYMTDEQFAELERREQVGHGGIANVHHIADRIAEYGRYGDDTLAHVETGELIVPKALLEKNPALKESILEHLEELGVEDPERYIVGSEFNSLNPDTQLPEFFFKKLFKKVKKTFKKIVKGVKKTLKKIGKVLKKASSVILPVVLNFAFPGMGAIMTGALSGGIGTLINGGNLKDALKAAAIGGVTGAVVKGGFNKITGKSGFLDTIKTEVTDLGNLKSQFSTAGGILDPTSKYYAAAPAAPAAGAQAAPVTTQPLPEIQGPPTAPPVQGPPTAAEAGLIGEPTFMQQAATAAENVGQSVSEIQASGMGFENQVEAIMKSQNVARPVAEALAGSRESILDSGLGRQYGGYDIGRTSLADPLSAVSGAPSGPQAPISSSVLDNIPKPFVPGQAAPTIPGLETPTYTPPGGVDNIFTGGQPITPAGPPVASSSAFTPYTPREILPTMKDIVTGGETGGFSGRLDATKELFFPSGPTPEQVAVAKAQAGAAAKKTAIDAAASLGLPKPTDVSLAQTAADAAKGVTASSLSPSMLSTYGPALAATGLVAQQMGAFETPTYDPVTLVELEESLGGKTAEQLIAMDPSKYRIDNLGRPVIIDQTLVPSTTAPPMTTMPVEPPTYYRQGGQAFPRRTGGIDPSEGVPNQDSVRAMLMPGEFVMTTKAVRGMSRNGDSREGIRNMYSMMRNLEARERKMG